MNPEQEDEPIRDDDEMRPEYDFRKLKLVGRGIYAERFRAGVRIVLLTEDDGSDSDSMESEIGM
ncbi:MAG: hypothetical protein M3539_11085 [Acidobacteriota bacterium]|nr:hypothetical protein [Acidobacteriota bacterium]